jgi:hypothetical protein
VEEKGEGRVMKERENVHSHIYIYNTYMNKLDKQG